MFFKCFSCGMLLFCIVILIVLTSAPTEPMLWVPTRTPTATPVSRAYLPLIYGPLTPIPPTPTNTPEPDGVTAWVSPPSPPQNYGVLLRVKLVVDGKAVMYAPVYVTWHFYDWIAICEGITGVGGTFGCQKSTGDTPVGYYAQINVSATWEGRVYQTSTGFTVSE